MHLIAKISFYDCAEVVIINSNGCQVSTVMADLLLFRT